MNQILQNLRVGLPDKHIRIEPNSVATEVADPAGKFISRKRSGRVCLSLVGEKNIGQRLIEQLGVEMFERRLHSAVFNHR